jgi:glycosyltransferase involved in cell wall biosynthesis
MVRRLAGQVSFVLQCIARAVVGPRADVVLVSTSPPFAGVIALVIAWVRGSAIAFWAMDINPEQALATGAFRADSPLVRLFEAMNRRLLRRARRIVVLDRYMAATLRRKCSEAAPRMRIAPPWPHEESLERIAHEDNPFRVTHRLQGKFVVMYSGNHSPVHPLETLLEAAVALEGEPIVFAFVGGGEAKRTVERWVASRGLQNVLLLPYQPLAQIRYSLSAADVHVVSMGEQMVGIVHPCKFYGAMTLGRPVLLLGPARSHVGDVLAETGCGWQVEHGDVERLTALLLRLTRMAPAELDAVGVRGTGAVRARFNEDALRAEFADVIEECIER